MDECLIIYLFTICPILEYYFYGLGNLLSHFNSLLSIKVPKLLESYDMSVPLSSVQHQNLTPLRFVVGSSQMAWSRVCECYSIRVYLIWHLYSDWCVIWWGSKNKHKDTFLKIVDYVFKFYYVLHTMWFGNRNIIGCASNFKFCYMGIIIWSWYPKEIWDIYYINDYWCYMQVNHHNGR